MTFQPESPRWLVEHGQYERAAYALAFAAGTSADDAAVQETLREVRQQPINAASSSAD